MKLIPKKKYKVKTNIEYVCNGGLLWRQEFLGLYLSQYFGFSGYFIS